MSLEGQVAIVTGGARGLGKAYAEAMLQRKAKVVIADIIEKIGQQTAEEFSAKYGQDAATFIHADVTQSESIVGLFEKAGQKYGHVDILINNAGIGGKVLYLEKTMEINLNGVIRTTEAGLERMSKEHGGRGGTIINIGSIAGITVMPGGPLYHASKHGVVGYTKSRALMTGESTGVKMHCICPSFVKTEMTEYLQQSEGQGDKRVKDILEGAGGWTSLEDVVSTCMTCIEEDIPQGSVILVSGKGAEYITTVLQKAPFP